MEKLQFSMYKIKKNRDIMGIGFIICKKCPTREYVGTIERFDYEGALEWGDFQLIKVVVSHH